MPVLPEKPKSASGFSASKSSKDLLRFFVYSTAGDSKPALIERLSNDVQLISGDQQVTLTHHDKHPKYSSFSAQARKFIVTDIADYGHKLINMIVAAPIVDLAVLLINVHEGILPQIRHQTYFLSLMGVKQIALVIDKSDMENCSGEVFDGLDKDFRSFAEPLGFTSIQSIPVSMMYGENLTQSSPRMPWYKGPALLPYLEKVEIAKEEINSFRLPVQQINRSSSDVCEISGTISSGTISVGDDIMVTSSLKKGRLAEIIMADDNLTCAAAGDAVTLVVEGQIDMNRGDVLATPGDLPQSSDQFQAKIIWQHEEALLVGRSYQLKIGTQVSNVQITDIKHAININTLEQLAARTLKMDEVAVCNFATAKPIFFDAYSDSPATGSFVLVDRLTNATVGVGMIEFGLRRADNLSWQSFETDAAIRAQMKGQKSSILWFTGLSASGKSTIVDLIDRKLIARGVHTYILDGDNVRHGLNKDLGFTDADRVENIRRVAEVARLMADAGLVVLVSFISPFVRERKLAREIAREIEFHEIYVDTPLEVCEARDPKGLYAKARAGDLANFTGISSPFEAPQSPDLRLPGAETSAEGLADMVIEKFKL